MGNHRGRGSQWQDRGHLPREDRRQPTIFPSADRQSLRTVPEEIGDVREGSWVEGTNQNQLSITHWEILHAVLNPIATAGRGIPPQCTRSLFCIRDSSSLPDPAQISDQIARSYYRKIFFEPEPGQPDRSGSLKKLLDDIERCVPAQRILRYSATWNAEAANPEDEQLRGRLTGLERFGCWVLRRLLQDIRAEFREHLATLRVEDDPAAEEAVAHRHYAELCCDTFVRRPQLERELTIQIERNSAPLFVIGPSGSGKTALLARWVMDRLEAGRRSYPVSSVPPQPRLT